MCEHCPLYSTQRIIGSGIMKLALSQQMVQNFLGKKKKEAINSRWQMQILGPKFINLLGEIVAKSNHGPHLNYCTWAYIQFLCCFHFSESL